MVAHARRKPVRRHTPLVEHLESRVLFGAGAFPSLALMEDPTNPVVQMTTQRGDIFIELLANTAPDTVLNYLALLSDRSATNQTFFHNVVPGVSLSAGTWFFFDDEGDGFHDTNTLSQLGVHIHSTAEGGRPNTERTIAGAVFDGTVIPGSGRPEYLIFNLADNSATRDPSEFIVFARVIDDASWAVVQEIASLPAGTFGTAPNVYPGIATYLPSVPLATPYIPGADATPELVVHTYDTQVVKAQGASDYYRYAIYSAEGFTGSTISEFVPIENPNNEPVFVRLRSRYEMLADNVGFRRDGIVFEGVIPANSRGGVTISTPGTWNTANVYFGIPYALEVISTLPVAAGFSHYDFSVATGESFVGTLDTNWFIGDIEQGFSKHDFILWHNPGVETGSVSITLVADDGSTIGPIVMNIGRFRRGGLNIADHTEIPAGRYSAIITSTVPILASHSHYGITALAPPIDGFATIGQAGAPSTIGVIPIAAQAGQTDFGPIPSDFRLALYNPGSTDATIRIDFFEPGQSVPTFSFGQVVEGGRRFRFVLGLSSAASYSVVYVSDAPIHSSYSFIRPDDSHAAPVALGVANRYDFGEGFTDPSRTALYSLEESVSIFNPFGAAQGFAPQDANVTLTFRYSDGFSFTLNRMIAGGTGDRIQVSSLQEIIDQAEQNGRYFYSIEVASDVGIVAQMMHVDRMGSSSGGGGFTAGGTILSGPVRLDSLLPG